MNMQALFDGLAAQWQRERAKTQMTLGELISVLESMPKTAKIEGICEPHSYRGYYQDLAFEPRTEPVKVYTILKECRASMGKVFTGYKGGDFVMGALTPVWVASYGCCGKKLIGINKDGSIETENDD